MTIKRNILKNVLLATSVAVFSFFNVLTALSGYVISVQNNIRFKTNIRNKETYLISLYNISDCDNVGYTFKEKKFSSDENIFKLDTFQFEVDTNPILIFINHPQGFKNVALHTDYPFLGLDEPICDLEVNSYLDLENIEDGYVVKVKNDEKHHHVSTIYKVNDHDYDLIWVDLGLKDNPLSSIIKFSSFIHEEEIKEEIYLNKDFINNLSSTSFASHNQKGQLDYIKDINIFENEDIHHQIGILLNYDYQLLDDLYCHFVFHPLINRVLSFAKDWEVNFNVY